MPGIILSAKQILHSQLSTVELLYCSTFPDCYFNNLSTKLGDYLRRFGQNIYLYTIQLKKALNPLFISSWFDFWCCIQVIPALKKICHANHRL